MFAHPYFGARYFGQRYFGGFGAEIVAAVLADLRPALRAFLLQDAGIAAVVGARIYPTVLPQGVRATSIVYSRTSRLPDHHMEGPSGLTQVRMQLDCWSLDFDAATALARLVKARLDGYRGPMTTPGPPAATVAVQGAMFDTSQHDYRGEGVEMYGARTEYLIWYETR